MHSFEAKIEKMKPAFEKIASNPYVSAIRDGFIAAMPIILFSSIFTLIAYVPNAWGFYWSKAIENALMLPYNYSMGLLALFVTATTAKNLTDYKNLNLPTCDVLSQRTNFVWCTDYHESGLLPSVCFDSNRQHLHVQILCNDAWNEQYGCHDALDDSSSDRYRRRNWICSSFVPLRSVGFDS